MCIIINVEASEEAKKETSITLQGRKLASNNISNLNLTNMSYRSIYRLFQKQCHILYQNLSL